MLARQAAAQYGLLSTNQLRAALGSDGAVRSFIKQGLATRRRRGVFALIVHTRCWQADLMELHLTSRELVAASDRSANRLWGLRTVDEELDVSVRYPANLSAPGVTVHRSRDLSEHDVTFIEALPVTTPCRTLCDAGRYFPDHEVERMVEHALAKGIVDVASLWRYRHRVGRQGRNGVGALDRVLRNLPASIAAADSGPEIAMRRICERANLPVPIWQHPTIAKGQHYVIDFAYPEARIAIEYDEFDEHTRPETFVRDRQRQNDLQLCGWIVMRFTWPDLRDRPGAVVLQLRQALSL